MPCKRGRALVSAPDARLPSPLLVGDPSHLASHTPQFFLTIRSHWPAWTPQPSICFSLSLLLSPAVLSRPCRYSRSAAISSRSSSTIALTTNRTSAPTTIWTIITWCSLLPSFRQRAPTFLALLLPPASAF